jgi:hypothetical protein
MTRKRMTLRRNSRRRAMVVRTGAAMTAVTRVKTVEMAAAEATTTAATTMAMRAATERAMVAAMVGAATAMSVAGRHQRKY